MEFIILINLKEGISDWEIKNEQITGATKISDGVIVNCINVNF